MALLQRIYLLGRQLAADFARGGSRQQPAAHADQPVNLPSIDVDAGLGEHPLPREHVAVHGVHERSIQIEDQRLHPIITPCIQSSRCSTSTTRSSTTTASSPI